MKHKTYVLDASSIIGGFYSKKHPNYIPTVVLMEIKDVKSQMIIEEALDGGNLILLDPSPRDMQEIEQVLKKSGDILRLSSEDKSVLGLALKLKRLKMNPVVVTDDYSIQNVLNLINIPYRSVLTPGIKNTIQWIQLCKGCKKKYPSTYSFKDCEICGSPIIRKKLPRE